MSSLLTDGLFQIAYVTNDLDATLEQYRSIYGIENFMVFDSAATLPGPSMLIGMAWRGPVMIELIQPVDHNPVYTNALPETGAKFHHTGHICPGEAEWDKLYGTFEREQIPIALEGQIPGLFKYMYADFRAIDGQYREYVLLDKEGQAFLDQVPRN